jgi:aspartate aminotransferase
LTVRIAFVDFDGARALEAAGSLPAAEPLPDNFSATYCPNCVTAIDLLCNWVRNLQTASTV